MGSKIILCTAIPGWYEADANNRSYESLGFIAKIADDANRDLKVRLVLTGDTHHYCRYALQQTDIQFITAGGGGAFLHPTHTLRESVKANWCNRGDTLLLANKIGCDTDDAKARYPSSPTSKMLVLRNLWFPITNMSFAAILGLVYWVVGILSLVWWPLSIFCAVLILFAFYKYADKSPWSRNGRRLMWWGEKHAQLAVKNRWSDEGKRQLVLKLAGEARRKLLLSVPHSAVHLMAIVFLFVLFYRLSTEYFGLQYGGWAFNLAFFAEMLVVGGDIGGLIFGIYLLISCLGFGAHSNEAFSALRIPDYRHFLRIRLKDGELTIYPIGVKNIPARGDWEINKEAPTNPLAPRIVPRVEKLNFHLIEGPIVVQ
jgi:hypothetical protein